jgi:hypothetical protein
MPEDWAGLARSGYQRRVVSRRAVPRVLVAVALIAGSLGLPSPAGAGAVPAAASFASCGPDGVTQADDRIAERLRPVMNGRRLGRSVNGARIACARAIVRNVKGRGLDQRAAVIALTTAITETGLRNYAVAVDHDSLGLFQQRPSMGWGLPGQLVDPGFATQAFLSAMIRKHPGGGWLAGDIGQICQRVQGSAFPAAYAPEVPDAHLITIALWPSASDPSASARSRIAPDPASKASGPYQRSLATGATGLVPLDARHDVSTADWNGDKRADLVVVQGAGTATGKTELRVVDGASSFRRFLLETGTALDPTDDRHTVLLEDWNGDGRPDLVAVQKSGTASGRTELRVFDGASGFQQQLAQTTTALGPTDKRHELSLTDWNRDKRLDLVVLQKSGTKSGKTDVRVLDGASDFRRPLVQTRTGQGATDDRHELSVTDWNGDGKLDLLIVQKAGTASGWTEARVLAG